MNYRQPTKPALNIRSLATPKPPQGLLQQNLSQPGRSTPSSFSSTTLPSPPFTPIVPLVPLPSTHQHHSQPMHSTPLYQDGDDDVNDIGNNQDVTFAKNDAGNQVAEQSIEIEVDQGLNGGVNDEEDSIPSVHVSTVYHHRPMSTSIHNKNEVSVVDNQENSMDTDSNTSLPSPGYVALYETHCVRDCHDNIDNTNKCGNYKDDQQNKVESYFELSLDSLVSDYPECGDNVVNGVNRQEDEEHVQVQFSVLLDHEEGPCANDRSLGCTPWASSPEVRTRVNPTGWTTSSPLSKGSSSPRLGISGWSDTQIELTKHRIERQATTFHEFVNPLGTWSSSSQPYRGTPTEQRKRTGWSTSSDSVEN